MCAKRRAIIFVQNNNVNVFGVMQWSVCVTWNDVVCVCVDSFHVLIFRQQQSKYPAPHHLTDGSNTYKPSQIRYA